MESSILSEVDDTSILRTRSPRRYGRPLNWLPASRLLPRVAGWSAATLCFGSIRLPEHPVPGVESISSQRLQAPAGHHGPVVNPAVEHGSGGQSAIISGFQLSAMRRKPPLPKLLPRQIPIDG